MENLKILMAKNKFINQEIDGHWISFKDNLKNIFKLSPWIRTYPFTSFSLSLLTGVFISARLAQVRPQLEDVEPQGEHLATSSKSILRNEILPILSQLLIVKLKDSLELKKLNLHSNPNFESAPDEE